MKKFYSFVLMATMLLIGTNAWANYEAGWLQEQFDNIQADGQTHTIVMEDDIILTDPVYLGTATVDEPRKSIILDMNGHSITMVSSQSTVAVQMFVLSHGELLVKNSSSEKKQIKLEGATYKNSAIFMVYGSYKSSRWKLNSTETAYEPSNKATDSINTRALDGGYFTHLLIDERVELYADGSQGTGIFLDEIYASTPALNFLTSKGVTYTTNLFNKGGYTGLAQGVRIDVKGDVNFKNTAANSKSYAIKANGMLQTTLNENPVYSGFSCDGLYKSHYNDNKAAHKLDTCDAAFIRIYSTAKIQSNPTTYGEANDADNSAAVYAGGYAKWLIEGTCEGNTALNSKSGEITVHDATLTSTYTGDYIAPTGGTGASGAGSAVVLNSTDGYAGQINVTVTGDTKISAESGYAIEDQISGTGSELKGITIEGGTIEGGTLGAIAVTAEGASVTTVYGGNISTALGDNTVVIGGNEASINDVAATNSHVTPVTVNGKTTLVISEGTAPDEQTWDDIVGAGSGKWTDLGVTGDTVITLADNVILNGELQIISGDADHHQIIVIPDQKKLQVKNLIMNDYARIIVEAGGKLIVTGEQGIIAPKFENIRLETSEAKQAIFLFNDEVSSNRHPNATVQLTSKAYYDEVNGKYIWQRFGVPTYADTLKRTSIDYNHTTYPTAWQKVEHQEWVNFPATEGMKPFTCYGITTSATEATGVYQFTCPLMGNDDATLELTDEWNYYANSYMAPVDIKKMIANIGLNNANVSGTIYLYKPINNWWYEINNAAYIIDAQKAVPELPTLVNPMQAFVLQRIAEGANPVINYKNQVYDPIVNPSASAPARSNNSISTAMIEIMAADGTTDCLRMLEDAQFSAEFDNSYDANKIINENSFNLFAGENLSIIATDNLEGTALSLNTKDQTSFTMTISHVNGMEYAIRDNLTGTEIAMIEGATYMFSTVANAKAEGRFEIVPVAKMPTAIENIEETAAVKGIYTITGQFVGNDYHSLPNGIYVVDGKKIVK